MIAIEDMESLIKVKGLDKASWAQTERSVLKAGALLSPLLFPHCCFLTLIDNPTEAFPLRLGSHLRSALDPCRMLPCLVVQHEHPPAQDRLLDLLLEEAFSVSVEWIRRTHGDPEW